MIYSQPMLLAMLALFGSRTGTDALLPHLPLAPSLPRLRAVPEWLTQPETSDKEGQDRGEGPEEVIEMMTVRFINTPSGKDVVAEVETGSNLLFIGDKFGVKLPRACRTGLCGSCTCEVKDPSAIQTDSNPRAGFATVRACSTKCFVHPGQSEMVVDVYRMQNKVPNRDGVLVPNLDKEGGVAVDPMARFGDNWEADFRPSWSTTSASSGAGQVGVGSNPRAAKTCQQCTGSGRVACYTCLGKGRVMVNEKGSLQQCSLCVGMCQIGCPGCRGKGVIVPKSKIRA